MSAQPFHVFGVSHVTVLLITFLATSAMITLSRRNKQIAARKGEWLLAFILLLEWPCSFIVAWSTNTLSLDNALPAHFCDVAAIIGGLALLTKKQELCELIYLWGLTGTIQGLITPALTFEFPHPVFFTFFALHSGVVITAFYMVLGLQITPRPGAVKRAMFWLVVYAAFAGTIDAVLGSNYGFMRAKPPTASLLDFMGPWPWYILSLGLLALVLFSLLTLPFRKRQA